jgi:hypothetical protein
MLDVRGRQVLYPGDPFGGVRDIVAWPTHNPLLRTSPSSEDGLHQGGRCFPLLCCYSLIEEEFGVRPPFGVVVLGDGSRVEVRNTGKLRSEVLEIAESIREHRRNIRDEIPVQQPAVKCRACGQRETCRQAREMS